MRIANACAALGWALSISLCGVGASNAATIVSSSNGWYQSTDTTAGITNNIYVGWNPNTGATYNNWTAFNLSSLAGQNITGATLTFYGNNGTYGGTDASETLGLFAYNGSINSLVSGQANAGIYNDLGTGASYGQTTVNKGPLGQISITLSAQAIADMIAAANNATDQRFVIGGSLLTVALMHDGNNWWTDGSLFVNSTLANAAYLDVQVAATPLPAALPMFASALAGGGLLAWRRKRKAAKAMTA